MSASCPRRGSGHHWSRSARHPPSGRSWQRWGRSTRAAAPTAFPAAGRHRARPASPGRSGTEAGCVQRRARPRRRAGRWPGVRALPPRRCHRAPPPSAIALPGRLPGALCRPSPAPCRRATRGCRPPARWPPGGRPCRRARRRSPAPWCAGPPPRRRDGWRRRRRRAPCRARRSHLRVPWRRPRAAPGRHVALVGLAARLGGGRLPLQGARLGVVAGRLGEVAAGDGIGVGPLRLGGLGLSSEPFAFGTQPRRFLRGPPEHRCPCRAGERLEVLGVGGQFRSVVLVGHSGLPSAAIVPTRQPARRWENSRFRPQRASRALSCSGVGPTFNAGRPRLSSQSRVAAAVSASGRVSRPAARAAAPGRVMNAGGPGSTESSGRWMPTRSSAAPSTSTKRPAAPSGEITVRNCSSGADGTHAVEGAGDARVRRSER